MTTTKLEQKELKKIQSLVLDLHIQYNDELLRNDRQETRTASLIRAKIHGIAATLDILGYTISYDTHNVPHVKTL